MTKEQPNSRSTKIDEIQSNQYSFPYHYIPTYDGFPNFSKNGAFSLLLSSNQTFSRMVKIEVQVQPAIDILTLVVEMVVLL